MACCSGLLRSGASAGAAAAAAAPRPPRAALPARLARGWVAAAAAAGSSGAPDAASFGTGERVLDLRALLSEARDLNSELIFDDDADEEPVWEHEERIGGRPMTADELAAAAAAEAAGTAPSLLSSPDPLAALGDVVASAYSAEGGFRQMGVEELSVALTAGGLIDLLLDVRSVAEFEAGPSLPGAINIPLDELSDAVRAGRLDAHMQGHVVVVCATGQRSAQATVRLSKVFGFQQVSNVSGGMSAWARLQAGTGGGSCGCGGGGCHG